MENISGESFYSYQQTIWGYSNIGLDRPKDLNLYFVKYDEGRGYFGINYDVGIIVKSRLDTTSTNLSGLLVIHIQY